MRGYGFFSCIYLGICLLITRVLYKPARLVRLPIFIRNKQSVIFSAGFTTGVGCRIDAIQGLNRVGIVRFGQDVQINDYCHIASAEDVLIEDDVLIASRVFITDHDHGIDCLYSLGQRKRYADTPLFSQPVKISRNVWLGEGVSVLKGVTIGENTIVGANSVVTKSLPANSVCVGIPAKVVKYL